jgi:ribosomal protein RSM22 (predicted rRNA methylase)
VQLPASVKRIIEEYADRAGFPALKRAATAQSEAYRAGRPLPLSNEESVAAYLVTRMPATYAAAHAVLGEVRTRIGAVSTLLDAGSGTGAASLAAREHFPEASVSMIEKHPTPASASRQWLPEAAVLPGDLVHMGALPPHDLVVASYSLSEFGAGAVTRLWQAARVCLVVIEPGTPRGFGLIRKVRDQLLAAGAHMAAPCPGEGACPVVEPDWCHFAARAERSSLHRKLKGGDLGYEDEKFSYVALVRNPAEPAASRIVRHPRHQPGLITLETCTPEGLITVRVSKRDRERFRAARHAAWGDAGIS